MAALIICLAISTVSQDDLVLRDQVDILELNHYYDGHGKEVFSQWIGWCWNHDLGHYECQWWRFTKDSQYTTRQRGATCGYVWIWVDAKNLRCIHYEVWNETWTQYDREIVDREHLPVKWRRGLRTVRRPTE
jgi:hypothetical protein